MFDTDGYIRVFVDLPRHPKSLALSEALKKPRAWTFMVELWLWASELRPDGDLSDCTDSTIARAAGFQGAPEAFVRGLRSAGFLDEGKTLVKWTARQASVVTGVEGEGEENSASERGARPLSRSALRMRRKRLRDAEASQPASHVTPHVTGRDAPPHTPPQKDNESDRESDARASHVTSQRASQRASRSVTRSWNGRGVIGEIEKAVRPSKVHELIAMHGKELVQQWPSDCVPDLATKLQSVFTNYLDNFDRNGPVDALARLKTWLARDREEFRSRVRGRGAETDAQAIAASARKGMPEGEFVEDDS